MLSCVVLALALSLVPATSRATVLIQKDLEDLVIESSDIVVGHVTELSSSWNAEKTRIYTHVVLEVERGVKGDFRAGEKVKFQTIGGRVGEVSLQVPSSPRFREGERVVVFFGGEPNYNTPVTGWEQGKYTVENDIILENGRYLDDFIGEVRAIMNPAEQ
jgi:hypothetical protein